MDDWTPDLKEVADSPIVENHDPTWKYNFKWAYDPQTGRFDMWKTTGGGIDGRPYHRFEVERKWGRPPEAYGGKDLLGVASYIPAEKHLDGTVVAPPVMLLQAYYGREIPQEAYDWVEENFPGTVARAAKLAKTGGASDWTPDLSKEGNKIICWVWNRKDGIIVWQKSGDGTPTHDEKILATWGREENVNDKRGYAVRNGDTVELESYDPAVPPLAFQKVKTELSKMLPQTKVLIPADEASDHGVSFGADVHLLARHEAAGAFVYAQVRPLQMPTEAPVSDSQPTDSETGTETRKQPLLRRLMRRIMGIQVESGADKDGAMIALFIPSDIGAKLEQDGGEPVEDMHITLVFFAEKAADRDDWDEVTKLVEQCAKNHAELSGKISGMGVFTNDEQVLWAAPSVPGLAELRADIAEAVEDAGFPIGTDHGWTPHITLKYGFKGDLPDLPEISDLTLDTLTFARGDDQEHFLLEGGFEKETSTESIDPEPWEGAHHFVTDGQNTHLVAEPRHEDGHEDEFRAMHGTEPDEETTEGWTIPTKDEMGFGIYAPDAGLKTDDEPQLHEIQKQLEKELDKPGHFIEDWDGFTAA